MGVGERGMQGLLGDILPGAGLKKKEPKEKSLINKYAKKPVKKSVVKKPVKKAVKKAAKKPEKKYDSFEDEMKALTPPPKKKKAKKAHKHHVDKEEPSHHLELGSLMGNLMKAPNEHTK